MGSCKIGKRAWAYVLALLMLVQTVIVPVPAYAGIVEAEGEYEIYPTPQEVTYGNGTTTLTSTVDVTYGEGVDQYTKDRVKDTLDVLDLSESSSAADSHTKLTVGIYGKSDMASYNARLGAEEFFTKTANEYKYDKYIVSISDGQIVIMGEDTDTAYYGVTTLKRIFEQTDGKDIRKLTIKDYADIEFRGFIEGYYGNPWSNEDRVDLMKFGGEIKMNQYIYAPKDDPLHNRRWRDLYDEENPDSDEGINKVKEMARGGNESKCFFVYALHPFMNNAVNLSDATYDSEVAVVKAKFEQVIRKAGVRQIAILEDDAGGETAEHMVRFLNDMQAWLEDLQTEIPDLKTDLLYCPTCYMATTDNKLTTIHNGVNEKIHFVMTGGTIWGHVSKTFSDNFYNGLDSEEHPGRRPYMWVNWPCNDNTKNSQIMGGHNTILHRDVEPGNYEGVILNPIQESESSKVGIFTASDFCWNLWRDEAQGDQAWNDAFKYIDHMTPIETESSNALREVAKHQIAQAPNQPQTPFEESVELQPKLEAFEAKMEEETLTEADIDELKAEFRTIYNAAKFYLENGTNRRMASQMDPFFSCLRDLAQANMEFMDALKAILQEDQTGLWNHYSAGQSNFENSQKHGFNYYQAGTLYAKAGRKYIEPFANTVLEYLSDQVKWSVDPEHIPFEEKLIIKLGGTKINTKDSADAQKTMDGKLSTNWLIKTKQKPDDYLGMTFNKPVAVHNIKMYLACTGHENDYIAQGVMEYTTDNRTWQTFESQPSALGAEIELELPEAMEIRGFRLRCTEPAGSDGTINRWLAIREISYNVDGSLGDEENPNGQKYDATYSYSSHWSKHSGEESNATDGNESTYVHYDTSKSNQEGEKDHSLAGDYIQLDLGQAKPVGLVRALLGKDGENGDRWTNCHLQYTASDTLPETEEGWTKLPSGSVGAEGVYEVNLNQAQARYIRLVNDETIKKWIAVREFAAYERFASTDPEEPDVPMDYTNVADANAGWSVEYGEESSKIFPKENATLQAGEYIGLKLDRIHEIDSVSIAGTGKDSLTAEMSVNESEWQTAGKGNARYIRLINKTGAAVSFNLTEFTVNTHEIHPMDLLDTNIGGQDSGEDARKLKTTRYWMDGDLSTKAKYCSTPAEGSYVTYDLGQEITLRSLRVYVLDTARDYPRDAVIESSADNQNWTEILTIGDGIANTSNDSETKPVESENTNPDTKWIHDTVDVAYAYVENANIANVPARYIRLRFTAAYALRWVELNEIRINNGEYVPSMNDPTFETDAKLQKGFEPQNLADGNLTTAFKPDGTDRGSLIYNLSENTDVINRINIMQSGNNISNANVSVRTGADEWTSLGALYRSYSSFYTGDLEHVYAVKIEWENTVPVLYEVVVLRGEGDVLEKNKNDAQSQISDADSRLNDAQAELEAVKSNTEKAKKAVDAAENGSESKLRAEASYYRALAKQYELEALVAELQASKAAGEAELLKAEAQELRVQATNAPASERDELIQQAEEKESLAPAKTQLVSQMQEIIKQKKEEQSETEKTAEDKKQEYGKDIQFIVTFESNGGSKVESQTVDDGKTAQKPSDPIRSGYTFVSWCDDKELKHEYDFNTVIDIVDITLYAKWKQNALPPAATYKITFQPNATGVANMPVAITGKKAKEVVNLSTVKKPTRSGYTFAGWSLTASGGVITSLTVTKDTILYAQWKKDEPKFEDGAEMTDAKSKFSYKVISAKKKTAMVTGTGNKKAVKVSIPATVTINGVSCKVVTVGEGAFQGMSKLSGVTLGKNVTAIEKNAFAKCKKLKTITMKGKTLKSVKSGAFKNTAKNLTVKVPKSVKKMQKNKLLKTLKKGGNKKIKVK